MDAGLRLFQLGDYQEAALHFSNMAHQNPDDGRAIGYLGMSQIKLGMVQQGITALQEAARLQPQDALTQYNLGIALIQTQQNQAARISLERALALDPGHSQARAAIAHLDEVDPASRDGAVADIEYPAEPVQPAAPDAAEQTDPEPAAPPAWRPFMASGPVDLSVPPGSEQAEEPQIGGQPTQPYQPPAPPYQQPAGGYQPPAANPQPPAYPPYGAPQGQFPSGAYSGGLPAAPGMQFDPSMHDQGRKRQAEPPLGTRLGRGALWGILYAQWWTLWVVFWDIIIASRRGNLNPTLEIIGTILFAFVFGFVGFVLGLIIGAANPPIPTGQMYGVVAGLTNFGLLFLVSHGKVNFVGIFFWFFAGQYVGALITRKVRQPVLT